MTDLELSTPEEFDVATAATFEQWATTGRLLARQHTGLHWVIGDWVAVGADRWADRWLDVASTVGIPHATLALSAAVSAAFPAETRHDRLSWSHHRAALGVTDSDKWLDRAEMAGWSARTLTEKIREAKQLDAAPDELDGMPQKPRFDRSMAARLLADGVRWVRVDLVTGDMVAQP